MALYRALRTFGNKIEGKRIRQGQLLELSQQRAKALNSNSAGVKLVEEVVGEAAGPLEKKGRAPIVRQVLTPAGNVAKPDRPAELSPRARSRARTADAGARPRKQNPEPPAPEPATTSRGGRGGAGKTDASSSQAAPAPNFPTSRARGNRTRKPAGSPSTNPTD